jgi:GNAT superfamily N-acetyltransferase
MSNPETIQVDLAGYFPGVVGKVIELHASYYYEHWGLDASFETQVARELAGFISEIREHRDTLRVAKVDGEFAGFIAVDGRLASTHSARLRWFIVAPRFQGMGIGRGLLRHAIEFSKEAGHRRICLWTFEGLDAARLLYEQEGFRLREEHHVNQWGRRLTEQMFELDLQV